MLIELVEEGLEAKQQKEKAFFELAERFRAAADPKEVERLGEELDKTGLKELFDINVQAMFDLNFGEQSAWIVRLIPGIPALTSPR